MFDQQLIEFLTWKRSYQSKNFSKCSLLYQMMSILNFSLTVDSGGLLRVCAFWLSRSPDLFLILLKLWKCVCLAALISCSLFGLRLPLLELSVPFFGLKKLRGKSRSTNRRDWAVFEGFLRTSKRSSRGLRSSNLQLKKNYQLIVKRQSLSLKISVEQTVLNVL